MTPRQFLVIMILLVIAAIILTNTEDEDEAVVTSDGDDPALRADGSNGPTGPSETASWSVIRPRNRTFKWH